MGRPAPGSPFPVGTAGRLLILALWNDRGAPRAFICKTCLSLPSLAPSLCSHAKCTTSTTNLSLVPPWLGSRLCRGPGGGQPYWPSWTPSPGKASTPAGHPQHAWPWVSPSALLSPLSLAQPPVWLQLPLKSSTGPSFCLVG